MSTTSPIGERPDGLIDLVVDGLELYGEADERQHPLPDALHPDGATHRLIGERFVRLASQRIGSGVFGAPRRAA